MSDICHTKRRRAKITAPGPKPKLLKIDGDWQDAVKESLKKKKPSKGQSK
jgi:hypothetical protein